MADSKVIFLSYYCLVGVAFTRCSATLLNVAERLLPSVVAATIIATEIRAAIKPYSIAVAPESSVIKDLILFILLYHFIKCFNLPNLLGKLSESKLKVGF